MNLRVAILILSLIGNIVLASFVLRQRHNPTTTVENTVQLHQTVDLNSANSTSTIGSSNATESASVASTTGSDASGNFQWSQLEAADYKEYISKLRAFGVSEKVVRDIIIADITKLFRPRFAALRPPKKPKNPNFWETGGYQNYYPQRDMTTAQREQTRSLQKEQTNLIKELLGTNVYDEMSKESGAPDWTERMYGPLSKEDRDKIKAMQERFQEEQSAFYAKTEGYMDQDSQADLAAIRKKHRAELATVLTPAQLEEYELRSSETAQRMKWELSSFEPDENEFRAIHAYKQAKEELDTTRNNEDKPLTTEEQKELQKKQKALDASLGETLGTNRIAEYKLMDKYEYKSLIDAGVPKESVFKIPDIQKQAEAAAAKLRNDKTLTDEQRNAALRQIKTETSNALAELIGERRTKYYQSNGGWWLRNLAPNE